MAPTPWTAGSRWFDRITAEANAGTILPEHITCRGLGALRDELPKDKTIVVYCNTSLFAAQVAMALRMDGFENVRLLYGGYNEWKARGGMDAFARASKKS